LIPTTFPYSRLQQWLAAAICAWLICSGPALAASTLVKAGANQNMQAHLMTPDGPGPYPAILLLHTSGGLDSHDLKFGERLVKEGYVVLVPAFLEAYGILPRNRADSFTSKAQAIHDDFVASLEQLRRNPKVDGGRIAAIGFSNGGYFAVWLAATSKVRAGISWYGALSGAGSDTSQARFQQVASDKSSPILILHGSRDDTVPIGAAARLNGILDAARAPHEFQQYQGAEHRFDRAPGASNETAAADAWTRTLNFLNANLQ
jgi:carboxymethylenebutenolidase